MINNIIDLSTAITWLRLHGFAAHDDDYPHKVLYAEYTIAAVSWAYEWRVLALAPLGTSQSSGHPHNVLHHLIVAPWVVDEIKRRTT